MLGFLRRRRRRRIADQPFPPEWLAPLNANVPISARLPGHDQEELRRHIAVFLAEKRFEGCGGLRLTDEIRVTIAAHACLLLLHRRTDYYPRVSSILVYPAGYVAPLVEQTDEWIVAEGEEDREGEASELGSVVLSWEDALADATDRSDGRNLVLHEFAHQLDMEDGEADGAPLLPHRRMYAAWARVMRAEYARLQSDVQHGRPSVLDEYGLTDPAEFFAVVTECFFESPRALAEHHPALYEQLAAFYQQDPQRFVS